jgi:hypothetical protein
MLSFEVQMALTNVESVSEETSFAAAYFSFYFSLLLLTFRSLPSPSLYPPQTPHAPAPCHVTLAQSVGGHAISGQANLKVRESHVSAFSKI